MTSNASMNGFKLAHRHTFNENHASIAQTDLSDDRPPPQQQRIHNSMAGSSTTRHEDRFLTIQNQ